MRLVNDRQPAVRAHSWRCRTIAHEAWIGLLVISSELVPEAEWSAMMSSSLAAGSDNAIVTEMPKFGAP